MDQATWVGLCVACLLQQWPHLPVNGLAETALELHADERWQRLEPRDAAEQWLRLGVLAS